MKRLGFVFAAVFFPVLFAVNFVGSGALAVVCAALAAVGAALIVFRKRLRIIPAAVCGAALIAAAVCHIAAGYLYRIPAQRLVGETINARVQVAEDADGARHVVRIKQADCGGERVKIRGKVVCYIYDETLRAYDTFDAELVLRQPGGSEGSMRRNRADGIFLYADVVSRGPTSYDERRFPQGWALDVRRHIVQTLAERVGGEDGAFAAAVITGDSSALSDDTLAAARAAGVSHLMAVSGLHLSVLNGFLLVIMERLRLNKWASGGVCILFTLGFMAVAAFTPSILRAGIMSIIMFLGRMLGRESDSLNSLGIAVALIGFINPYSAVSASLILSALATLGIVVFSPVLMDHAARRFKMPKAVRWAVNAVFVTASAVLFTLPASIVYFSEVSALSVVSNLLLSVPVSVVLACGLLLAVFVYVPGLGVVAAFPVRVCAAFSLFVIRRLAALPLTTVYLRRGETLIWLAFTAALAIGYFALRKRFKFCKKYLAALSAGVLLVSAVCGFFAVRGRLRLEFLDVGQADCSFAAVNGHAVVVDCGADSVDTARRLIGELKGRGVYSVDTLILSHFHDDHAAAAAALMRDMRVGELIVPAVPDNMELRREVLSAADRYGVTVYEVDGDRQAAVGELQLEIYGEHVRNGDTEENERCLIVNLNYGDFNCLFMGDAGFETEEYLVGKYGEHLQAEILKAGHHGSNGSSGYAFLNEVLPQLIVVPMRSGAWLPGEQGLARLQSTGAPVYQTGIYGDVAVSVLPDGRFYVEENQ